MARKVTSLDGDCWELGQVMHWQGLDDVNRWTSATVPGNVRADLLAAGRIEDPFPAKNNELSRWVDDWNWWYRRSFEAAPGARRTFIRFEGIDYHSHIFINDRKVAENTGMFAPVIVETTELLRNENSLCVCVEYSGQFTDRMKTLKCQMGFGWDFAPSVRTMGIWDSVSMIQTGEIFIRNLWAEPVRITENYWELKVTLDLDSTSEMTVSVDCDIEPDNFKGDSYEHKHEARIQHGTSEYVFNIPMKNPKLWNVWEEGAQNLYGMKLALKQKRKTIDNTETRFGMRSVTLHPNDGRPEDIWTFVVNEKRKFIRGANWVPADSLPGRVTKERYRKLLDLAKKANINLLRVWGGGLREKKDFYDLCDEMGILVWQEFPFACPRRQRYPDTAQFRNLVSKEIRGILGRLHNHPSVAMYCGGNEFGYSWNRRMVNRIERQVRSLGGGRMFKVTSPTTGESHNWKIFHMMANIGDYRKEDCAFLSEFGMQAPPVRESLDKFIPRENQWPVAPKLPFAGIEFTTYRAEKFDNIGRLTPGGEELRNAEVWTYHDAHLYKIFRYAKELGFTDVVSFIEASQKMQAFALQTAIEHIRRRKYIASGVAFWQFNEPWPTICWSVVDYYLKPKPAYETVKRSYSPLLLSLQFDLGPYEADQSLEVRPFMINDRHRKYDGLKADIRVVSDQGSELEHRELDAGTAQPDSIRELDTIYLNLRGDAGQHIVCSLSRNGKTLCTNEYDLTVADSRPTMKVMLLGDWMLHNILWK